MDDITAVITPFCINVNTPYHRDRSWNYCYEYFSPDNTDFNEDAAALNLGFYLASWGMYRGAGFLPQFDYKVHTGIVGILRNDRYINLRGFDILNENANIEGFVDTVMALKTTIANHYNNICGNYPTDTLITKIMLGALGCTPALDTYFINGLRIQGVRPMLILNVPQLNNLINYIRLPENHIYILRGQEFAQNEFGQNYPVMKIVDMYFFQKGTLSQ